MDSPKNGHSVMTIEAAYNAATDLVQIESHGRNMDEALKRIEKRTGISSSQIMHLYKRRAKKCDIGLFARLRGAYLEACELLVRDLQHRIAIERALADDDLEDIAAEAAVLAEKLVQARKARGR